MTIKEFANNKNNKIKEHVVRTYSPIAEKIAYFEYARKMSIRHSEEGIDYIDMNLNRMWFVLALFRLYTDIEPDIKDNTILLLEDYDVVSQTDLVSELSEIIGDKELDELLTVNKSILDNFNIVSGSFEKVAIELLNKFSNFIQVNSKSILDVLNNEKLAEIIKKG